MQNVAKLTSVVTWITFTLLLPQAVGAQPCNTQDDITKARLSLATQVREYKEATASLLRVMQVRTEVLQRVNSCKQNPDLLDDLTSTLTLQRTQCNKEIDSYNALALQEDGQQRIVETMSRQIKTMSLLLQSAQSNACQN